VIRNNVLIFKSINKNLKNTRNLQKSGTNDFVAIELELMCCCWYCWYQFQFIVGTWA